MLRLLKPTDKFIKFISNAPAACTSKWMGTATTASYEETLLNAPRTKMETLNNGLRVATESTESNIATIGLYINTGAKFETKANNGVSYLFEHLAYKGTKKRSQIDLELEVENLGAQLSANTSRELTTFQAKCFSKDVPKIVEILSDVIQNSKLDEAEIEKQREAILRELDDIEKDYRTVISDYFHSVAYQGTPLEKSIYGTTKSLKSISKQDIVDHIQNRYKAPRIVLAGAGGVEHEALVHLAEEHLKGLEVKYDSPVPREDSIRYTGGEITLRDDAIPMAHIGYAVEGVGYNHSYNIPLTIASMIVGSWDRTQANGSHRYSRVCKAGALHNYANSFESFNINYKDTGLWGIYFACERSKIDDFTYNLQEQWIGLCTAATDFEVELGKNILRTKLLRKRNETSSVCDDIGKQMLFHGRRIPIHELDAQIEEISSDDVREACYNTFYDRCPVLIHIGPVEEKKDYNRFRSNMYWLRL